MPKRQDLKKILVLGAGPIIIGQACEFDYSGSQACKALKEEGYTVILVNSNPATIMTDPELADITYIEPVTPEFVEKIIIKERPCAMLATMGGQTALNVAFNLAKSGFLALNKVELIGANFESIELAEDRELFKQKMLALGLDVPRSFTVTTLNEIKAIAYNLGYPIIVRPAFTLGGLGGGIAYNHEELDNIVSQGLNLSPIHQVLLEESVIGYKEIELEVMRDKADNTVIICSIENFDPMGIHTGDSITVAPVQTLSDKEYQNIRNQAIKIIRAIGIESGGSNVQFGVNPQTGRIVVIEMNPRVSRSSALASKATGYPIAKISAKLAIGLTLDEISNDITKNTFAAFEPSLDYVVTKIPRFNFDKFKGCDTTLTTTMKAVGEVMAIGRTFAESIQKALRSLELGIEGFEINENRYKADFWQWRKRLNIPSHHRLTDIFGALKFGISLTEIQELTNIDKWFLEKLVYLFEWHDYLTTNHHDLTLYQYDLLYKIKSLGFSDRQIAKITNTSENDVYNLRKTLKIQPSFKNIDTCSSEFVSYTPYLYSTYEEENEIPPCTKKSILILGGGPNRIGQGIEFDYACVHAAKAIQDLGYEAIMVNSNPETVSTDFDISDRLYFEPVTLEDVSNIANAENAFGIIVQLGGQTPLKLTQGLIERGFKILGTSAQSIDRAEDRLKFNELIKKLKLTQPNGGFAYTYEEVFAIADKINYPVLVRPSYVLGGKQMEIIYTREDLKNWLDKGIIINSTSPILIDEFLEGAIEIDVDAISDGRATIIAGIMEHIEQAGIHSGDSTCVLPTQTIPLDILDQIKTITTEIAQELKIIGLLNIQFALRDHDLYILEANPRASRTIPFVSKATGVAWAYLATKVMLGKYLNELDIKPKLLPPNVCVKSVVIPFKKFPGSLITLGPEMRSTGEVMGISQQFGQSFAKAQIACGNELPKTGTVFISVSDIYKSKIVPIALNLYQLGFELIATRGTATAIHSGGIPVQSVNKIFEGRPNLIDRIKNQEVQLVINIPSGRMARSDDQMIRQESINYDIPVVTTLSGAKATIQAIAAIIDGSIDIKPLQEYHDQIIKQEKKHKYSSTIKKN